MHRHDEAAGVVDEGAPGLEEDGRQPRRLEVGQAVGDGLGILRERGRGLVARQVLRVERVARGEAAAEIEVLDE